MVGETDDLIAVHKPASVPVHVSGQYRKNTVMALLQLERPDLGRLFPVHRLDKPVSGLLLFAKNAAAAHDVCTQIMVSTQHCWEGILCQPVKYHEHLHILSGELHVLAGAGLMLHSFANTTHMQLDEHAAGTLLRQYQADFSCQVSQACILVTGPRRCAQGIHCTRPGLLSQSSSYSGQALGLGLTQQARLSDGVRWQCLPETKLRNCSRGHSGSEASGQRGPDWLHTLVCGT